MPADIAVVIVTVCRQSLLRAVRSVYAQDFAGSVHLLIGIDIVLFADREALFRQIESEKPERARLTILDLGYSTSTRHGGIHGCHFGGSLRTILTFAADAAHVCYLDDDDWWESDHLRRLQNAIGDKAWAFSLCWYADGDTGEKLFEDRFESLGPGAGIYNERFGGFVRPSALMLDKLKLPHIMHLWAQGIFDKGDGEDRLIFNAIKTVPYGATGLHTVCHAMDENNEAHKYALKFMKGKIGQSGDFVKAESVRAALPEKDDL